MSKSLQYLLLFGAFGLLLIAFLKTSPVWYDDTGHWRVVKHYQETGQICYLLDSETEDCDPNSMFITLGPGVQEPARIWMGVFGSSMLSARAFILPFSLLMLLAFLALSRQVIGDKKALWASLLIIGNIQLLTYGSQFLGELPMLMWIMFGLWFQMRWLSEKRGSSSNFLGAMVCFLSALACKESVLLPLGGGMFLFMLTSLIRKDWSKAIGLCFQGICLGLGWAAFVYFRYQNGVDFAHIWELRQGYQKEFFAFEFGEALRYLFFKPLILLGMIALAVKMYFRRDPRDWFLGLFFFSQLIFFLLSKGYDRFGFQLIFIPAIYLSEFVVFGVKWLDKRKKLKRVWQALGILLFLLVFSQRTFPRLISRIIDPQQVNQSEKCLTNEINRLGILDIFTYDEQIISFLPEGVNYRLEPMVHVNSDRCATLQLELGEYFVAGKYARTEFDNCVVWDKMEQKGVCGRGEEQYLIYSGKK